MSGASEARNALRTLAISLYPAMHHAAGQYGRAHSAINTAPDVMDAMQASVSLILAAEALAETAEETAKKLRAALTEQIIETGAVGVRTEHHTAFTQESSGSVYVTDPDLVPKEFWRHPPPAPDKIAIGKELRAGRLVAGTTLSNPGRPTLVIKPRKEIAA